VISYEEDDGAEKVQSDESDLLKLKILIAEDNPTNQKVITAQLGQLSQVADIVNNGAEAISKLKENSYDLVLLDILMPIMDGEETIKIIRNSNSRISSHYCVALTASSYEDQRDRLIKLGFDEFLSKPLSVSELSNTLKMVSEKVGHDHIDMLSESESSIQQSKLVDEFSLDGLTAQFGDAAEMFFMEIAPTFLEQSKNDFRLLKEAIEQDRVDGIRRISHSIKGAALSMGLTSLADCLEKIEHKPDSISVHELYEEAENLCLTSALMIEALMTRLKVELANV
jgi:CheY-like chemotaxis protein